MRIIKSFAACLRSRAILASAALAHRTSQTPATPSLTPPQGSRAEKLPKPKKVFTDDDIAPKPSAEVPAASNHAKS
jgi:hypothetical protein